MAAKPPSSLVVRPICAKLTHDTETFGSMDPYCVINFGAQHHRTRTATDAGKFPNWSEEFLLKRTTEDVLNILVYDEDTASSDDVVGEATFPLSRLGTSVNWEDWVELSYKGRRAGEIRLSITLMREDSAKVGQPGQPGVQGYPQGAPGAYPPQQGYAPPQQGYPPQGYPPQQYPPQGYPQAPGGYPAAYPGAPGQYYPPVQGFPPGQGYPPPGGPGYPPAGGPGYPPAGGPGYPPPGGPGYAPAGGPGYPPPGGYPQPGAHPPGGYPQGPGYPNPYPQGAPPGAYPQPGAPGAYPPQGYSNYPQQPYPR